MSDKPFIALNSFCSNFWGSHRDRTAEQTRVAKKTARNAPKRTLPASVTILQQIEDNPQFGLPVADSNFQFDARDSSKKFLLFLKLGDAVREPRHFALRRIAVHDIFLRCTNECGLGIGHGRERLGAVAGGDRFFDLANGRTDAGPARFIDDGAAHGLAGGLFGRFGISHQSLSTIVNKRGAYKAGKRDRQRRIKTLS
jgi:hypothetical protein